MTGIKQILKILYVAIWFEGDKNIINKESVKKRLKLLN